MNKVHLWGYTICDNGNIYGVRGKKLNNSKQVKINGKLYFTSHLVYYAFNQDTFDLEDRNNIIIHLDGNQLNHRLSNLKLESKKIIVQGENNIKSKLTDEQVEEIKELYKKGKEEKVDKHDPRVKYSYRQLAEMYGVSHTLIKGIIKGHFRNKENYIIK
jgi:hypothetical protein